MDQLRVSSVPFVGWICLAVLACPLSTVRAQDDRPANEVEQLKQIIAEQQKQIQSLDARVARLEETHRILRFDQYVEAARAAEQMGPVQPSGKPVSPDTVFKADDRVLVEWSGSWWNGQVLELLPNGSVKIHYQGWGAEWDEVVPRTRLQLPAGATAKKP